VPTYTIYASTTDCQVYAYENTTTDGSGALAGTGATASSSTATTAAVGSELVGDPEATNDGFIRYVYEQFISFDCSTIGAGESIDSVTLTLTSSATGTRALQARKFDWGSTVTAADWRTPTQLTAASLYASTSSVTWTANTGRTLTLSGSTLATDVAALGTVRMVIVDAQTVAATVDGNYVTLHTGNAATAAYRPTLTVTTSISGRVISDALRIEVGYGSTPSTPLALISWTDVSSSVMLTEGVSFSRGRSETDTLARPGTLSLTLDNSPQKGGVGRFSTKTVPWGGGSLWADSGETWHGYSLSSDTSLETASIGTTGPIVLRMPIRVRAQYPYGGATYIDLWLGYVEAIDYGWQNGRRPLVKVSATDRLARLQKRTLPSLTLGEQLVDSPTSVWPLDDPILTTTAGNRSTTSGISALAVTQLGTGGTLTFGSDTTAAGPGYGPGPDDVYCANFAPTGSTPYANGKYLGAASGVANGQGGFEQTLEAYFRPVSVGYAAGIVSQSWGAMSAAAMYLTAGSKLEWQATGAFLSGTPTITGSTTVTAGAWHHAAIKQTVSSGTVTATLYLDGVSQGSTTYSSDYVPSYDSIYVGVNMTTSGAANLFNGLISNVAYYGTALSATRIAAHAAARDTPSSYTAEAASTKFATVCRVAGLGTGEYALQTGTAGTTSATMMPIPFNGRPLLDAITDIAQAEGSVAYLSRSGVMTLACRDVRYGASVAFTLPATIINRDTDLTADLSFLVNDVTVTRPGGASVRAVNTTSIAAYDTHDQKIDNVYVSTDAQVTDLAGWYANLWSTPTPRVNDIAVDLVTAVSSITTANVLGAEVGSRFQVTGLPADSSPTPTLDLFVEGVTDQVNESSWVRKFVGSPVSSGYSVMTLDDDVFGILDSTATLAF
jgi:hypothetical protein